MRVAVCYPQDFSIPSMPFGALPLFSACLRAAGHEVAVVDVAAETFRALVVPERIEESLAKLEEGARHARATGDRDLELGLARLAAIPRDLLRHTPVAAARLRDPATYFDPGTLRRDHEALLALVEVFDIVRPRFDPRNQDFAASFYPWLEQGDDQDPWVRAYDELFRERLRAFAPGLVALTVPFGSQLVDAMRFARWVKRTCPGTRVVAGGTGISDAPAALEDPRFFSHLDFVVTGDGDEALVELADALDRGTSVADVPSLHRLEDGAVVLPANRRFADMDRTPTPDYSGLDWELYLAPERIASVTTSRGCYYGKCTFCPESFRANFRRRSSGAVWRDVRALATEQGVDNFMFWDPLTPPAALTEVAERSAEDGVEIHWMAQVKFDELYADAEHARKLRRGGCEYLQFGFESGVQRVLDTMEKGNELERVERITRTLTDADIGTSVTFFIGFPTEREEDARETWRYLVRHRDRIQVVAYVGPFGLYEDLPLFRDAARNGLEIYVRDDGLFDYRHEGRERWDTTYLDETFGARNDIDLVEAGTILLYHRRARGELARITALTAFGPPSFARESLDDVVLRPATTNGTSRFEADGEVRRFVFVGASSRVVEPGELEQRMMDSVERAGELRAGDLLRSFAGEAGARTALAAIVDRGLVASSTTDVPSRV